MQTRVLAGLAAVVLLVAVVVAVTWSGDDDDATPSGRSSTPSPTTPAGGASPTTPATTPPAATPPGGAPSAATPSAPAATPAPVPTTSTSLPPAGSVLRDPVVTVRYRVERRTADAATASFASVVEQTLTDPRGWSRAGFRLVRDDRLSAPFVVVLAEADEVDRLCRPYDTYGRYSCQNGPVVALNADRWRTATPQWTGDLDSYRQMLVNHEVGHLLGMRHPPLPQCPVPGRPALVMSQQSTELDGCLPNPWPLDAEVERAARHDQPLAPPYER